MARNESGTPTWVKVLGLLGLGLALLVIVFLALGGGGGEHGPGQHSASVLLPGMRLLDSIRAGL
jgi:hypothetical protein